MSISLKIDVEGAERDVFLGADFERFRPWIVVVEATAPNRQILTHTVWEELLTVANYRFVWFDGLNRFYIAGERWERLSPAFAMPPNVFDDFIRATDTEHLNKIVGAETRAGEANRRAVQTETRAVQAEAQTQAAEGRAQAAEGRAQAAEVCAQAAEGRAQAAEAQAQAAEGRAQAAEAQAQAAEGRAQAAEAQAQAAEGRAQAAEGRASEAIGRADRAEAHAARAEARVQSAEAGAVSAEHRLAEVAVQYRAAFADIAALRASTSWKATAPLRFTSQFARDHMVGLMRRKPMEVSPSLDGSSAPATSPGPSAGVDEVATPISSVTYEAAYRNRRSEFRKNGLAGCRGRVLLDVSTSLAWRGAHAVGIVRTERELAARLLDDPEFKVLPVVFHNGTLRMLEPDLARSIVTEGTTDLRNRRREAELPPAAFAAPQPDARPPLRTRMIGRVARPLRASVRVGLRAVPLSSRDEVRLKLIHARQAIRNRIYAPQAFVAPQTSVVPQNFVVAAEPKPLPDLSLVVYPDETDVLFCAGLGWDVIDWDLIGTLRQACNLRMVSMLYDLIPVRFPEMLGQPTDYYERYFLHILDECDLALCISECSRQDLVEFAAQTGRSAPSAEVVLLGANVPATPSASEFVDAGLQDRLAHRRFALSVGTFEIRKNYNMLIDLWHELIDDHSFDLDLVIVGMAGWCVEDVLARLRASPLFGSRIFWLQGVSDAGLSWLYESCHVFLYPSLYEGWGLPVVEALQHGRPVIASNRGGVPEAGLGLAEIIDPDDQQAWRRAIIAAAHAPRGQVLAQGIPTWDHTAEMVKGHLLRLLSPAETDV